MKDLLNQIIEKDEDERKLIEQAIKNKELEEKNIEIEKEKIINQYIKEAKEFIDKEVSECENIEKEKLDKTSKQFDVIKEKLEDTYNQNKDKYINDIYNSIIK